MIPGKFPSLQISDHGENDYVPPRMLLDLDVSSGRAAALLFQT